MQIVVVRAPRHNFPKYFGSRVAGSVLPFSEGMLIFDEVARADV